MKRWIALAAAAVAVAAGAGRGDARMPRPPAGTSRRPTQPSNPRPQAAAAAAAPIDTAVEATFTPITPCRIVDTRRGGGMIARNAHPHLPGHRHQRIHRQGGNSAGCGIPAGRDLGLCRQSSRPARPARGYITIYPNGVAKPLATALSFATSDTRSSNTNATLGSNGQIRAYIGGTGHGATQLVLDVTGYYIQPLRAEVSSNGTLVRGSRVTSVDLAATPAVPGRLRPRRLRLHVRCDALLLQHHHPGPITRRRPPRRLRRHRRPRRLST